MISSALDQFKTPYSLKIFLDIFALDCLSSFWSKSEEIEHP